MLNEEKIKVMTKLSAYEQGNGKKEIPMSRYFRSDYVSLHMVKTVLSATVAYLLLVVVCLIYDLEGFMNKLTEIDLFKLGKTILTLYVAFVVLYMVIAYVVYSYNFKKVRENLKVYNAGLKKINRIQEEEGRIREEIETGGNDHYDDSFNV